MKLSQDAQKISCQAAVTGAMSSVSAVSGFRFFAADKGGRTPFQKHWRQKKKWKIDMRDFKTQHPSWFLKDNTND